MSELEFSTAGGQHIKAALEALQKLHMQMSSDDPMKSEIEIALKKIVTGQYFYEQAAKGLIPPDELGLDEDVE